MKTKPRLKGLSDIRRSPESRHRDPLPLVREYQQKAIDAARKRDIREPMLAAPGDFDPTAPILMTEKPDPAKTMPIQYGFGGDGKDDRHWIEVAGERYFCDEIDEAAARKMIADVQAGGQVLTPEQVEAGTAQLIETGRFWSKHEAKQRERREAQADPVKANAAGIGYAGPAMPDKGLLDGSCNRTACQMPLKGKPQFWMKNYSIEGGRLHYCADCAKLFDEADREFREPRRCTPV